MLLLPYCISKTLARLLRKLRRLRRHKKLTVVRFCWNRRNCLSDIYIRHIVMYQGIFVPPYNCINIKITMVTYPRIDVIPYITAGIIHYSQDFGFSSYKFASYSHTKKSLVLSGNAFMPTNWPSGDLSDT